MKLKIDYLKYKRNLKIKSDSGQNLVWDRIRKKYIVPTPEEMVRQLFVEYLIEELQYSPIKIGIERKILVNDMVKRFDIFVVDKLVKPYMLVECKAPEVPLTNEVFEQVSLYNQTIRVPYIVITNGIETYCAHLNYEKNSYSFLEKIPEPA
ncbi:MAG: type I restriction enzyme HsdR N-terminal domain-containing protein [Saprospiraceae bacterium]|jgi:hypothetical protein|nr:type I restriction enzyme HsdR N-terminal domain-containing protein [Saprospiraceae bacterium]